MNKTTPVFRSGTSTITRWNFDRIEVALQETQGETEINNQSINNLNFTTMPFWKKAYQKKQGVYYPQAIVQGKPVETETIAKDLAKISTVSNSDVQAVLGDIAGVMHTRMAQGKSVHIKGLGYFRYTLDTVGVENLEDFDFEKQVKTVRVEFIPERTRLANGTYTRALVDSDQLEWIELSPDTQDSDPAQDEDDEDVTENPLG